MICQPLGDARIGHVPPLVFLQSQRGLNLRVNILDADENMLSVPGKDLRMADVPDLTVHHQAPVHRKGMTVLQVIQHHILVMQAHGLVLVLGVYVLPDASAALGKEIVSRSRHVQPLVIIRRRDFPVGAVLDIDVIQRVILLGKAAGNLIVGILLPGDLPVYLPLPNLGVHVVQSNDQARTLFFLDHGGVQLYMEGSSIHHNAIAQGIDTAAPDLRHDIVLVKL